jgi:hypothetical protein
LYTEYQTTPLKSGDVISVGGAYKNGYHGEIEIGEVDPETKNVTSYQRILVRGYS